MQLRARGESPGGYHPELFLSFSLLHQSMHSSEAVSAEAA